MNGEATLVFGRLRGSGYRRDGTLGTCIQIMEADAVAPENLPCLRCRLSDERSGVGRAQLIEGAIMAEAGWDSNVDARTRAMPIKHQGHMSVDELVESRWRVAELRSAGPGGGGREEAAGEGNRSVGSRTDHLNVFAPTA